MQLRLLILILLFLLVNEIVLAQNDRPRMVFESSNKRQNYYIEKLQFSALFYEVIRRDNPKAGTSYYLEKTDTLLLQPDGSYSKGEVRFFNEGNQYSLAIENSKHKKIRLEPTKSLEVINARLNNAYFNEQYSKMINELNKKYSLSYISWVEPYHIWQVVINKEIGPAQFKAYTDDLIKETRESYIRIQDRNTSVMNHLVKKMPILEYDILKDSLFLLPVKDRNSNQYFRNVINTVAQQKPEYFFLLAEQYPLHRDFIFNAVEEKEETIEGLKKVEGHDKAKQAFLKERRFGKTMIFRIAATYAIVGGLITWLIISQ